jgi:hypothetical protein
VSRVGSGFAMSCSTVAFLTNDLTTAFAKIEGRVTNWAAARAGRNVCLFMVYFAKLPASQTMWDDWYMQS